MEFLNSEDKIKIEGPPEESEKAREQLDAQAKELVASLLLVSKEYNFD